LKKPRVATVDDDSAFAGDLRTFLSLRDYETRSYSRGDADRDREAAAGSPMRPCNSWLAPHGFR
jgi:hypothetical protein